MLPIQESIIFLMCSTKNQIHICHITSVHSATDVRIFTKECRSLAEAGYNVSLISPGANYENKDGVRIIGTFSSKGGRLFRMTVTVRRVFQAALEENAHVYHFHDPELIPFGLFLRILGKKVIYDVHEDYPLDIQSRYWLPFWMKSLTSWFFKRFENFSARYFNCVVSATPAIAKRFKQINDNTVTVQNFPRLNELSTPGKEIIWQDRSDAVIFAGGFDISRGIKETVEAIKLVQKKLKVQLILAGRFSPKSLQNDIQKLPGWKHVEYRGFVSRKKLAELLRVVKAGLDFRHPESQYQVAYPIKIFEYMSVGIPVIISNFPLWQKIVDSAGCGLLVNPLDPQAIAESIIYILENPEEAEEMGKRGKKAIEEIYNWSNEEIKLLEAYKDLLE